jgi:lipoyl synthase
MNQLSEPRPSWLVQRLPAGGDYSRVNELMEALELNTVCRSANCPNIGECFGCGTATFLILGRVCSRNCSFCAVPKGAPQAVDITEPDRLARAVAALALRHVVITSVTRDDLTDGGAAQFAACVRRVADISPGTTAEVLTPDFGGDYTALDTVLVAKPAVFNHNMETVPRLYSRVRPGADYRRSMDLLARAVATGNSTVKSGLMVGLGERPDELYDVFTDLVAAGVSALTIGQYLRPSRAHLPVIEYITPEQFGMYEKQAYAAGLKKVAAGPLVRSSYRATAMIEA